MKKTEGRKSHDTLPLFCYSLLRACTVHWTICLWNCPIVYTVVEYTVPLVHVAVDHGVVHGVGHGQPIDHQVDVLHTKIVHQF